MIESLYNFTYNFDFDGDNTVLYNSRTQALAALEKENYRSFKNYLDNGEEIKDKKFLEMLKSGGYLVQSRQFEKDSIRYQMLQQRYAGDFLSLTIAPTTKCNFDCAYCYEKNSDKISGMPGKVQDALVDLVKNTGRTIRHLDIVWYGGEPLLALDVIENLSKRLIDVCREMDIEYTATIVTNGYLLNKKVVDKLKELRITGMQVTLDGPPHVHNKRRPLIGGGETFDKILNRLAECSDYFDNNISLRINVDRENSSEIEGILDILEEKGLKQKISVYLGYVDSSNNCYQISSCMSYKDFAFKKLDFDRILVDRGFQQDLLANYPYPRKTFCAADTGNSFVIAPNGDFYRCWDDIGLDDWKIGNIAETVELNMKKLFEYLLYDPTEDENCSECQFLPVCMGGCPRKRLNKKKDRCVQYKYNLEGYLKECTRTLYQKMKEQEQEKDEKPLPV